MFKKISLLGFMTMISIVSGIAWGADASSISPGTTVSRISGAPRATSLIMPLALSAISGYGDTTTTFLGMNIGALSTGNSNTFIGAHSGENNTAGYENTFLGYSAGISNTGGIGNTYVGSMAGSEQSGTRNTVMGYRAAGLNTGGGSYNCMVGALAGWYNTSGSNNCFMGDGAGSNNTTGSNNVIIGKSAGADNHAGSGNVLIGYGAGGRELDSNKLYIDNCFSGDTLSTGGYCTQPLIYGEFDSRTISIDGSLTMVSIATPSDYRYKKEIQPLESSLNKILRLQGVTYKWDKANVRGAGYTSSRQIGLIAQEVEKILPELVHTDRKGYKTLSYDKLAPVLVEAVKEQQLLHIREMQEKNARIDKLEQSLSEQQQVIATLIRKMAAMENQSKSVVMK